MHGVPQQHSKLQVGAVGFSACGSFVHGQTVWEKIERMKQRNAAGVNAGLFSHLILL